MKFTCTVSINKPVEEVVALWGNEENRKEWQDGYLESVLLSGTDGIAGAKTRMTYLTGKHKVELIETILVNDLPREFTGLYEAKEMVNTMKNEFIPISEGKTNWTSTIEYTKFNGFVPRLMAYLLPGFFRKQAQKWHDQFKEFAERS